MRLSVTQLFVAPLLLTLFLLANLRAGVVEGVVLENASGRPLSRTIVRLEPVATSGGQAPRPFQLRTNRTGGFVFGAVPPGLYKLVTQRPGFLPAAFGQRRPTGQGTPIQVTVDSNFFAELRMARMGAITGRVLDENGVGIQGVSVLAYPARLPLRSVSSAVSDDRGVYRIAGLPPAKYWVRSAAYTFDDGSGILPTFAPRSREIRDARIYEVKADGEVIEANVEPEPGALFRLTGRVGCDRTDITGPPVTVTLSSETIHRSTRTLCTGSYSFEGLAPAAYEILAVYDSPPAGSGFVELQLDNNSALGDIQVTAAPQVEFTVRDPAGSTLRVPVQVSGRRDDLSGEDSPREIPTPRAAMAAGHWELHATAGSGQFVQSITTGIRDIERPWRNEHPTEWFEVFLGQRGLPRVQIVVSNQAGQLSGTVMTATGAAPGSPVFMWPVAEANRRSLGGARTAVADTEGHFRFDDLPPGDYRLFSSFDFSDIAAEAFDEAQAAIFTVTPSQNVKADLRLWVAP